MKKWTFGLVLLAAMASGARAFAVDISGLLLCSNPQSKSLKEIAVSFDQDKMLEAKLTYTKDPAVVLSVESGVNRADSLELVLVSKNSVRESGSITQAGMVIVAKGEGDNLNAIVAMDGKVYTDLSCEVSF